MSETKHNENIAVDILYHEMKNILGDDELSLVNICGVLVSLMQFVEQYDNTSGVQKKKIILVTFNRFITNNITSDEMKTFIQLTLPTVIDTFISIDKKEISIKLQKGCNWLLSCCK